MLKRQAPEIQALIFDLDGVIVDTEFVHLKQLEAFIATYNPSIRWEQLAEIVGASSNHFFQLLGQLLNQPLAISEVQEALYAYNRQHPLVIDYPTIFRKQLIDILDYAKERELKLGLASSSEFHVIEDVIETCQIADYFDLVMTGKEFSESKPDPTIYLEAAKRLEVLPDHCLAIEDSFYGIRAAKRAGMRVIAYEEKRLAVDQSEADYIGKDMRDILGTLKKI